MTSVRSPLHIARYTATSALGRGLDATLDALRHGRSGLSPRRFETATVDAWIGEVDGLDDVPVPAALRDFDCRNHRLAWLGLQAEGFIDAVRDAAARLGPRRVGVFLGTSTSGILETEIAYRRRDDHGALPEGFSYRGTHNVHALGEFVRAACGLGGPSFVVSSACSSSAKVFAAAARMIEAGLVDAAVVGGVDSLCLTTLHGFASLELVASQPCRPFDAARAGISIGEAAAFALLERAPANLPADAVLLSGAGESSDAHHMSSPHPEGAGALAAMRAALAEAGLSVADIDYVNLHGTATRSNDAAEGRAMRALFGEAHPPASSTKGATGHTLGAAGGLEAVICALALREGLVPASVGTLEPDASTGVVPVLAPRAQPLRHVLSNSFGFGGTNCSLVLGRAG